MNQNNPFQDFENAPSAPPMEEDDEEEEEDMYFEPPSYGEATNMPVAPPMVQKISPSVESPMKEEEPKMVKENYIESFLKSWWKKHKNGDYNDEQIPGFEDPLTQHSGPYVCVETEYNDNDQLRPVEGYSGTFNFDGRNGQVGVKGRRGQAARRYPENGKNGEAGRPGEQGWHGKNVSLVLEYIGETKEEIRFTVKTEQMQYNEVKLKKNKEVLLITANGGNGGNGGDGGKGGLGIEEKSDENISSRSNDGYNGSGGIGGNGGNGGHVTLKSTYPALFHCIKIQNYGGLGGEGGKKGGYGSRASSGNQGKDGSVTYVTIDGNHNVLERSTGLSSLHVDQFLVEPDIDDGVIEQGEYLSVSQFALSNKGSMSSPENLEIRLKAQYNNNNHWVGDDTIKVSPLSAKCSIELNSILRGYIQLNEIKKKVYDVKVMAEVSICGYVQAQTTFHVFSVQSPVQVESSSKYYLVTSNSQVDISILLKNISTHSFGNEGTTSGSVSLNVSLGSKSLHFSGESQPTQDEFISCDSIRPNSTRIYKKTVFSVSTEELYSRHPIIIDLYLRGKLVYKDKYDVIIVPHFDESTINEYAGVCYVPNTINMSQKQYKSLSQFFDQFNAPIAFYDCSYQASIDQEQKFWITDQNSLVHILCHSNSYSLNNYFKSSDELQKIVSNDNHSLFMISTKKDFNIRRIADRFYDESRVHRYVGRKEYSDYFLIGTPKESDMEKVSQKLVLSEEDNNPYNFFHVKKTFDPKKESGGIIRTCYSYGHGEMYKSTLTTAFRLLISPLGNDGNFPIITNKTPVSPDMTQFHFLLQYFMALPIAYRCTLATELPSYYPVLFVQGNYKFHDVVYMSIIMPILRELILSHNYDHYTKVDQYPQLKSLFDFVQRGHPNVECTKDHQEVAYNAAMLLDSYFNTFCVSPKTNGIIPKDFQQTLRRVFPNPNLFDVNNRPTLPDFVHFNIPYYSPDKSVKYLATYLTPKSWWGKMISWFTGE